MAALRVSALAAVEADVEAGLALDLGAGLDADLAYGFDHNNAPGPGPVVAFLQPSDFVRRRGGPGFDAAVALLHCLVVADNRIGKAACYLFDEEKLGIVVQAALVALEGKRGLTHKKRPAMQRSGGARTCSRGAGSGSKARQGSLRNG